MADHAQTPETGFLSERQRRFIDRSTQPPRFRLNDPQAGSADEFDKKTKQDLKWRIKEEKANSKYLIHQIQGFRDDLERIRNFWVGVEGDAGKWERAIANNIDGEIKRLDLVLDSLAKVSEETSLIEQLESKLGKQDGWGGDLNLDSLKEYEGRYEALMALLRDEGLLEIFRHIEENPGGPTDDWQPDKNKTGSDSSWRWWTAKYLDGEYGLVENVSDFSSRRSYVLTDRGEDICEVIDWLENMDEVKSIADKAEISEGEAAAELIQQKKLNP